MSKLRVVGSVVSCTLAIAVAVVSMAAIGQDRKDSQPAPAEYTVASASNASEGVAVEASRVLGPAQRQRFAGLPDTLTLIVVGTMLIGLAAAVRRTT